MTPFVQLVVLAASLTGGTPSLDESSRGRAPARRVLSDDGLWGGAGVGFGVVSPLFGMQVRPELHAGYRFSRQLGLAGTLSGGVGPATPVFANPNAWQTFPHVELGVLADYRPLDWLWLSAGPALAWGALYAQFNPPTSEGLTLVSDGFTGSSFRGGVDLRVGLFVGNPGAGRRAGLSVSLQVLVLVHPELNFIWQRGFNGVATVDVLTTVSPNLMVGFDFR